MAAEDPIRLPGTAAELEAFRKSAKVAYKARSYPEAVSLYRRILESQAFAATDPKSALADRTGYATALTAASQLDEAAVQFEQVISAVPDDPKLRYKLAQTLSRLGRHREAIEQLTQAAALEPDEADYQWRLAVELRAMGRDAEAREALYRALTINPNHTEAQLLQLDQAMLATAERDGMVDEADERERDEETATVGRFGGSLTLPAPARPAPRLRHHPAMITAEALLMLIGALWLRSLFT